MAQEAAMLELQLELLGMSRRVKLRCTVIISGWMHRLHFSESWPSFARNLAGCPDVAGRLGAARISFWERKAQ